MTRATPEIIVDAFGLTDVGVVRVNNEDNFLIENSSGPLAASPTADGIFSEEAYGNIFIVADGMGGMQAGEVASQMAVELVASRLIEQLKQQLPRNRKAFARLLTSAVEEANKLVLEESERHSALKGMGTTLTAAAIYDNAIYFAQLGDSRAYLVRNGYIKQTTKDQSLVAQLIATGALRPEDAKSHPRRNVILQALGVQPHVDVAITCAELKRGDRLVLCSDGLWGKVEPEEINEHIERSSPALACQSLVQLARERGGEDNITIIIASFDGAGLSQAAPNDIPSPIDIKPGSWWRFWNRRET
jgi:serine/threonine protein phosphatase PrpC